MNTEDIRPERAVFHVNNPSRLGVLTGQSRSVGRAVFAEIDWGSGAMEFKPIHYLALHEQSSSNDPILDLIRNARYGTIQDARLCITFQKLQGTLTDVFYSMLAADMDFYPHQFKPVLRFVDSPTSRLLIADEVGLGKTIEAGLIWLECQARFDARRLLVVCPNSLKEKWVMELSRRFNQPAKKVTARDLLGLFREYQAKGPGFSFCAVCNYHQLRPSTDDRALLEPAMRRGEVPELAERQMTSAAGKFLLGLLQDESDARFANLVVLDEAHYMRNTATATNFAGQILTSESESVVCLSATPLHNQARDLYAILNMVDPDTFETEFMFNVLRSLNHPVVQLQNQLSRAPSDAARIRETVRELREHSGWREQPKVLQTLVNLAEQYDGSTATAARMYGLAEEMNLLGTFLCRTRKVQIEEHGRVQRDAKILDVHLSETETRLYRAVLRAVRRAALDAGDTSPFRLILSAQRLSSCLPVLAEIIRGGQWGGMDEIVDAEQEEEVSLGGYLGAEAPGPSIEDLEDLRSFDFEANDTKYGMLLEGLRLHAADEQVIVFAFFKDTVYYLERRLRADGFDVATLTGDIADTEEREAVRTRFEAGENRILVCSEIAAEGLDLQFCRIIVNYDLPWNPMRVEQRIGRVDRIGQRADKVTIINFFVPGTIDGHIFEHLYRKLGVFTQTIGELEPIIGEHTTRLTRELLAEDLTEEQEQRKIEAAALALEQNRLLTRELEESNDSLLAHRDYLAEQVGLSRRLGRYVSGAEVRQYLDTFFSRSYPGCHLDWDTPAVGCGRLALSEDALFELNQFIRRNQLPVDHSRVRKDTEFALTVEALEANRQRHRSLFLLNHLHPLVRWVTAEMRRSETPLHRLCAIQWATEKIPRGPYLFLIRRVDWAGLHKREVLAYSMVDLKSEIFVDGVEAEAVIHGALVEGRSRGVGREPPPAETLYSRLVDHMNDVCGERDEDYRAEMELKVQARSTQLERHFDRKLEAARKRIETLTAPDVDKPRGLELARSQLRKLEDQREHRLAEVQAGSATEMTFQEVLCGILENGEVP